MSADLSRTLKVLTQSEGTVQKLIADPSLYNNINESAVGVARILARLEKVSRDLEVFADKIARKPETIGVGGALRPSTGLKESPTAPLPQMPVPPLPPSPQPVGGSVAPIAPVPLGVGEPVPVYKPSGGSDLPPPPKQGDPVGARSVSEGLISKTLAYASGSDGALYGSSNSLASS